MARLQMETTPETDEALMRAYEAGSDGAFSVLYERYRERVLLHAWRILRRRELAEELSAEVFVQIAQGAWSPTGSFRSFLFTLVHRRCLDRLRRQQRWERLLPRLGPARLDETPEQSVADDQRRFRLERALADLSEPHRAAILLFYGEDLSSREIAAIQGCTDQQVRSRLSYARQKLRGLLADLEEAP